MHGRAVGRDMEIDLAWERLARAAEPAPHGVLIEGEPGIGKSVVWGELTARLRGIARVMEARPAEAETGVSYAAVGDLLRDVTEGDMADLPDVQRVALEVAALRREPVRPVEDVRAVGTALAGLWRAMAIDGRLAIAIDDVQWLDGPSASALSFALRRVPGIGIQLLLAGRPTELPPFEKAMGRDTLETVRLAPLPTEALRDIVETSFGHRLDPTRAHRLYRLSRGNPLLALEIARAVIGASDDDGTWDSLAGHAEIGQLAARRLATLPPTARRVLAMAAALGDPDLATIGRAQGSPASVSRALRRAVAEGVVAVEHDRVRFSHPLLAASAYGALAAPQRRTLHRSLAEVVGDDESRARHLALGHLAPDESVAQRIMVGSERAGRRGAPDAAADLAEAALRLTPHGDPATVARRTIALALALTRAGDPTEARARCLAALDGLDAGPERTSLLSIAGQTHLDQDGFQQGIDQLTEAATTAADPRLRATVEIQLAYALVNVERPRDASIHAADAVAAADALGDPRLRAAALGASMLCRYFVTSTADAAEVDRVLGLAGQVDGLPTMLRPGVTAGLLMLLSGRYRRASELLGSIAAGARDEGDEAGLVSSQSYVSLAAIHVGDTELAQRAADEAYVVSRRLGGDITLAWGLVSRARLALALGDAQVAQAAAIEARTHIERAGWLSAELWPASILGALAWAEGDATGAIEELAPIHLRQAAAGFTHEVSPAWADLLEAWVAVGRVEDARWLVEGLRASGPMVSRPRAEALADRGDALLAARDGRLPEALDALAGSWDRLASIDSDPYEEARTLLLRGRIERRAKRRTAARASLEGALARFEQVGARLWADRTRAEVARLGSPTSGALTETERQVALLAARGLTNREVAAAAFVTPKSVEGILGRAYAKLGIRSRAELGAWAAGTDGTDASTLPESSSH